MLVPCLKAFRDRLVVVLMDGHRSRINLQALEYAKNHDVHFFLLPPHSDHFFFTVNSC